MQCETVAHQDSTKNHKPLKSMFPMFWLNLFLLLVLLFVVFLLIFLLVSFLFILIFVLIPRKILI